MNEIENQIEFFINTADYNKILDLLNREDYRQNLTEEDYYFYKGYCLLKLENENMISNSSLRCFIKVLSINASLKYKNAILNLIREIYLNGNFAELDYAIEFVNELKKILPSEDIFIIKVFYYFYWMGIYSPETFMKNIDTFLNVNKTNSEIYEIKANLYSEFDEFDKAIENLQTALLLNKNAKDRYLKKIKKLKEQE